MSNSASRKIGPWVGAGAAALLASVGVVALRHALETPQPLKSVLPGEAHLYRWQRRSIFYKVLGAPDAPPLLLLHRPETGSSGHEMASIMAPLAETYRVYALDLLGFGLSDKPGVEYSAQLYNDLCQDFLREVIQRPATLLASGLSCNFAVAVAANTPELCTSLVLISPLALQGQPISRLARYAEKPPVKALLYPLLSTHTAFRLTQRLHRENAEDFAHFYANTHQLGAEHAAMARLAGRLAQNVEPLFETLQQPVLIIWGTHALDSQQAVNALHRCAVLANSAHQTRKVELIQQAAREVHTEQPANVVLAIKRWQAETRQEKLPSSKAHAEAEAEPELTTDPLNLAPALSPSTPETQEIEQAPGELAGSKTAKLEIIAYCVKCKQRRPMQDAHEVIMKNGRPAMRGVCPVCGTGLNRIGGTH